MKEFLINVSSGITANFICGLFIFCLILFFLGRSQNNFNIFFGVKKRKQIFIFMSTIIIPGGVIRSSCGKTEDNDLPVLAVGEFDLVPDIYYEIEKKRRFYSKESGELLDFLSLPRKPEVRFQYSMNYNLELWRDSSIICIGSPHYNEATKYHLSHGYDYCVNFSEDAEGIKITAGEDQIIHEIRPLHNQDIGILIKRHRLNSTSCVFIAAGIGVNGTKAATHYLLKNWNILREIYGENDFAIVLQGDNVAKNNMGYKNFHYTHQFGTKITGYRNIIDTLISRFYAKRLP